ncbi:Cof-type HAD-IIB family hydrolase [Sporolactobacillus kofuensis]|uniref:Cof-type HAD-IIB family hydrolase n=1 Tax=Sporolactobacillus kofuensis TaxID=269672 RepID=A0ABW1WJJ6_9BACL|nr:Cof-type HAD-IIB family hydrolase [Sporolactobacillus kofuensis]MCO7176860.1 Cof-type HAD-IIB family hydrolase [Sporolactobacillus kofuensis]
MSVKMIFSDIDGTLINSNHVLTTKTIQAIKACTKRNIPFILVSARMPRGIFPLQKQLGLTDPIVCYSGALIIHSKQTELTDAPLLNVSMGTDSVNTIYGQICNRFPNISFSAYSFDQWLVSNTDDPWIDQEYAIAGTPMTLYDFHDEHSAAEIPPIHKVLCMGDPVQIDHFHQSLSALDLQVVMVKSKPTYLEIMADHVSKASAMQLLLNNYNIRRDETLAFGDNYNDLDMLRFAGIGVAMENAPGIVKGAADFVTLSNDQDGIQAALDRFGLLHNE